jgi:hypothetical protein
MDALSSLILWGLFLHGSDGKPLVPEPLAVSVGMQFLKLGMTLEDVETMLHLEGHRNSVRAWCDLSTLNCSYPLTPRETGFMLRMRFERCSGKSGYGLESALLEHGNQVVAKFEP